MCCFLFVLLQFTGVLASSSIKRPGYGLQEFVWQCLTYTEVCDQQSWQNCSADAGPLPPVEFSCTDGPRSRCKHAACICGDKVFVYGGKDGNIPLNDMWSFDTAKCSWKSVSWSGEKLPSLQEHTMVTHQSSIYIFGGSFCYGPDMDSSLWKFDTDTFTCTKVNPASNFQKNGPIVAVASFPISRRGHTAVVHDNSMFIYGGYIDMKGSSGELWRFCYDDKSWILEDSLPIYFDINTYPVARHSHSAVIYRHHMWIYGGLSNLEPLDDLWTWHFDLHCWTKVSCRMGPPALSGHSASVIGCSMYLLGGFENGVPQCSLWRFDFDFLTWTRLPTESVLCGPLTKHSVVTISQSKSRNQRHHSVVQGVNSTALSRNEPQRSTFPLAKLQQHFNRSSSDIEETRFSSYVGNQLRTPELVLSRGGDVVSSKAAGGDCESVWNDSNERLVNSRRGSLMAFSNPAMDTAVSSEDVAVVKAAKGGSKARISSYSLDQNVGHRHGRTNRVGVLKGVNNNVFNGQDDSTLVDDDVLFSSHRLAACTLSSVGERRASDILVQDKCSAVDVELDCYSASAVVDAGRQNCLLWEDLEEGAGGLVELTVDNRPDVDPMQLLQHSVQEAWESPERSRENYAVDNLNAQSEDIGLQQSYDSTAATNTITMYVFGGQTNRHTPNLNVRPLSVYRATCKF